MNKIENGMSINTCNYVTQVTRENVDSILEVLLYNGFKRVWVNAFNMRLDRYINNKLEIVYLPIKNFNYKRYLKNEIHYLTK